MAEKIKKQILLNTYGGMEPSLIILSAVDEVVKFPESFVPTPPPGSASVFLGWSLSPTGEIWKGDILVTKNMIFYAVWYPLLITDGYQIMFRGNGATGEMESIYAAAGDVITLPPTPDFVHPLNYDFIGWSLEAFDPSEFVTTLTMNQNYVVYAIWKLPPGTDALGAYHKSTGRYVGIASEQSGSPTEYLPVDSDDSVVLDYFYNATTYYDRQLGYDFVPYTYAKKNSGKKIAPTDLLEEDVPFRGENVQLKYPDLGEDYVYNVNHPDSYFPNANLKSDAFIHDLNRRVIRSPYKYRPSLYHPIIMPPRKQFKGFSHGFNQREDDKVFTDYNYRFSDINNPVCVYREGDPKYNITIDANDGSGDTYTIEKIENEFFWLDSELFNLLGPEPGTGMTIKGYSLRPDGEPLYNEGILIYEDTTLYVIWAYPNENDDNKEGD